MTHPADELEQVLPVEEPRGTPPRYEDWVRVDGDRQIFPDPSWRPLW